MLALSGVLPFSFKDAASLHVEELLESRDAVSRSRFSDRRRVSDRKQFRNRRHSSSLVAGHRRSPQYRGRGERRWGDGKNLRHSITFVTALLRFWLVGART